MKIIKRPLDDNEYFHEVFDKKQIYLHHTVSSTVDSTFNWWQQDPKRIGTAYIIDKDGTIYEVFDPKYWAYHIGIGISQYEKNSIGIELVNESWLTKRDNGNFYWLDNKARYRGQVVEDEWRGHKYWADYPNEQMYAAVDLVKHLTDEFDIKKQVHMSYDYDPDLVKNYEGVLSHCNVRSDKTDISVAFELQLFEFLCFPKPKPIDLSKIKPLRATRKYVDLVPI